MTMEALPEIDEVVKVVAADLGLTTIRAERGWEAFAKAAGSKFGEAGAIAAFQLRTDQEQSELAVRRGVEAEEWRASSTFGRDVSRIMERVDASERWASGRASNT